MLSRIPINYLIAVPLIVMSYHIYSFYETEPILTRIALAISFDVMVVVCFYLLKDPWIKRNKTGMRVTWGVLLVLISFQLYVNVWAFWELHWARAFISGSIFPITVACLSFIGMLREQGQEKTTTRKPKPATQLTTAPQKQLPGRGQDRPWKDKNVPKEAVIKAWGETPSLDVLERFRGARNWKSVKNWVGKLNQGETP